MKHLHTLRRAALDMLFLVGIALVCWGIRRIYPPAGMIAAGLALTAVSVIGMLGGEDDEPDKRH